MINDIVKNTETTMQKSVEALHAELAKLRTGRAHTGLVDNIKVDYYGTPTALNHVATVTVSDARTLTISPWEKNMLKPIEKAIMTSDLGLNPASDGNILRIPLPALTEERRKDLVRILKTTGEHYKVTVRNERRDANNALKDLLKKKEVAEDDEKHAQDQVQKLTDKYIAEIDKILSAKEADLMSV